jgi:4-hydroxy-tetrahydrodipicolinate synthase
MFQGSIPALITPFHNGEIDEDAFRKFIDWQIEQGSEALVPCGTTGESSTLSHEEHKQVIRICVEEAAKRVPVIAGTGSNSTKEAIELAEVAKKVGADAVLSVAPYYNKPTQEGLYQHFKAIHDAVDIPIVLYNIPPRSGVDISLETMVRLAELPRIVGVKDATHDLARPVQVLNRIGPDFCQLSGDDATSLAFLAQGGSGCISVTANVVPKMSSEIQLAWRSGDITTAQRLNSAMQPLCEVIFAEASPGPIKYAAKLLGLCLAEVRLPIVEPRDETKHKLEQALRNILGETTVN